MHIITTQNPCHYSLCILYAVSPGYGITFNATEYEFDVNVYSPVGTVVFEALIVAENASSLVMLGAGFNGSEPNFGHFSINGMDFVAEILPIRSSNLLTIRIAESLDPQHNESVYEFSIFASAVNFEFNIKESQAEVTLYEIGKLLP